MAFGIARQRVNIDFEDDDDLEQIASNSLLNEFYLKLLKDLDFEAPKHPDAVYKLHLDGGKNQGEIDSSKMNIAHTIVNALVNAGSGADALMLKNEEESKGNTPWIYRVKNDGMTTATASIGMINLWDIDNGTGNISEYLELKDGHAKMGALIGIGLMNLGIRDEMDTAKGYLNDAIDENE